MIKKYLKVIGFSIFCIYFFWIFQFIGGSLFSFLIGQGFLPVSGGHPITASEVTTALANRISLLTMAGDVFVVIITLIIIRFILRKDIVKYLELKTFKLKYLLVLIPLTIGATMFFSIVSSIFDILIFKDTVVSKVFASMTGPISTITTVIVAPIAEELVFRGLLFNYIYKRLNVVPAIIISSIAFGIFHHNGMQGIYAGCLGIVLSLMYLYTKSICGDILVHIIANGFATLVAPYIIRFFDNIVGNKLAGVAMLSLYIFGGITLMVVSYIIYMVQKNKREIIGSIVIALFSLVLFIFFEGSTIISSGRFSSKSIKNENLISIESYINRE